MIRKRPLIVIPTLILFISFDILLITIIMPAFMRLLHIPFALILVAGLIVGLVRLIIRARAKHTKEAL
jgi:hypothetical protein